MGRQRWWHTTMAPIILALPLVYSLSLTPAYRTQAAILHPALAAFLLPARDVGRYGPYTDSLTGTREAAYGSDRGLVQGVSRTMYFYHVTPKGITGTRPEGTWKVWIDPTATVAMGDSRRLRDSSTGGPPPNVTGTVPPGQSVGVGNWLQVVSDRGQCGAFAGFSVANVTIYVEAAEDAHASDTRHCHSEEEWVLHTEHLLYHAIAHST